jgi:hypothetical protein
MKTTLFWGLLAWDFWSQPLLNEPCIAGYIFIQFCDIIILETFPKNSKIAKLIGKFSEISQKKRKKHFFWQNLPVGQFDSQNG